MLAIAGLAAVVVFANAIPLGFALDDDPLLRLNPVVTEGRLGEALAGPYWHMEPEWGLLYRPVTLGSFVLEWSLWGETPPAFHAVNVAAHAGATVLAVLLLLALLRTSARADADREDALAPALLGGLVFAVHPVHVEAVANVVGRSELYAAAAVLAACLAFLWRPDTAVGRAIRLSAVLAAYAVGLGSKEIAVTLPGLLLLLAVHPAARGAREGRGPAPASGRGAARSLRADAPLFAGLVAVLLAYLAIRMDVLGTLTGEELPAELVGTTPVQRLWTALTLWPQYLRLMIVPLDLVADYGPDVLSAARQIGPAVLAGAVVLGGLLALAATLPLRMPLVSLGILWFVVAVLPVAHLGVHAGVLLAERTLYLPSVGLAMAVAGGGRAWLSRRRTSGRGGARPVAVTAALVLALLGARTVTRTPVWDSSFTLFRDLAQAHPESHRALRLYGEVLYDSGRLDEAAEAFGRAAEAHPYRYPVLLEAGAAYEDAGDLDRAQALFERAVEAAPFRRSAYRLLAATQLRAREGRAAHRTALVGLERAGSDAELWALLSEAYLLRGDLGAALRARRAALAADPDSLPGLARMAEILEMSGDTASARRVRERAARERARRERDEGEGGRM
ncbi:MAG: hypothetical protein PVI57_21830 [Gemmatimonadota bacterium]